MAQLDAVTRQILEMVRANPNCTLEQLTFSLVELHWSEVFCGVDHLSRSGQLKLNQNGLGLTTTLRVIEPELRRGTNAPPRAR